MGWHGEPGPLADPRHRESSTTFDHRRSYSNKATEQIRWGNGNTLMDSRRTSQMPSIQPGGGR